VVLVGFAARGTPARRLVEGATRLKLFGRDVPVRATIHTINGFSAHADQGDLLAWHRATGSPAHTVLVHGEPDVMETFGALLEGTKVLIPHAGESMEVG
jgi:metallo-beta-lactamase family protein